MATVNSGRVTGKVQLTGAQSTDVLHQSALLAVTGDIDADIRGTIILAASTTSATITFADVGIDTGAQLIKVSARDNVAKSITLQLDNGTTSNAVQTMKVTDIVYTCAENNHIENMSFVSDSGNATVIEYLVAGN